MMRTAAQQMGLVRVAVWFVAELGWGRIWNSSI
jgi:hypothetical protein